MPFDRSFHPSREIGAELVSRIPPDDRTSASSNIPQTLPEDGLGEEQTLDIMAGVMLERARDLGDPGFFAHMDPPTPWITWITSAWAGRMNQNLLHTDTAPAARDLEHRVIAWLAPFFGMRCGQCVPGSTLANFTALWAAREQRHIKTVVASEMAHVSVLKAAQLLGLEYRSVPVDSRYRLDATQLGDVSNAALVLTAGTTSAGAIDPLDLDAAWIHVDAAWAGPLRLSERHRSVLDGIERADSVAISAHKWFFQPKESALVFFADPDSLDAISFGASYLAVPNVGLLGSHGASAASSLLATLLAWGRSGMAARIDRCMNLCGELAELVRQSPEFELLMQPSAGIVLWRHRSIASDDIVANLTDAFVSVTTIDGVRWLRSVAANPMADPQQVFRALKAAAQRAS